MASNSVIVSETISGVIDRRVALATSSLVRPHGLGTSWTILRVGIRYQIDALAEASAPCDFFVGLCSGTVHPFGDPSATNCFGMVHTFLGGYAAASGGNMACAADGNSGTTFSAKNVGGVITKSAGINDGQIMYLPLDPTAATRRMLFVDVTKGSPNYSFSWFYCLSATASPDVTQADFTTQVQAATPSFTNHAFRGTTATGLAFSEAAGTLDCVNVFWPLQMHRMHICDVAAVKIA